MSQDTLLKEYVKSIIQEDIKVVNITLSIATLPEASSTEVVTLVRALEGVVTVTLDQKAVVSNSGRKLINATIKFIPPPGDVYEYLAALGRSIKRIGLVDIVHIYRLGGYEIKSKSGEPLVY